jgi:hypothetical protein
VVEVLATAASQAELLPGALPQQLLLYAPQELAKHAADELGNSGWVVDLLTDNGGLLDRALPCAPPAAPGIEDLTTEVGTH